MELNVSHWLHSRTPLFFFLQEGRGVVNKRKKTPRVKIITEVMRESKGSKHKISCGHDIHKQKFCSKITFKIIWCFQDDGWIFCFQSHHSQPRNNIEVLCGFIHLFLLSWSYNRMARLGKQIFRWSQGSELRDKVFRLEPWTFSSKRSEDSWALPIW